MSTISVPVVVSKEMYELGAGLAAFLGDVKAALADGWQLGADLPVFVSAAIGKLVPAIQGVEKIPAEILENKVAFANACAMTGTAVVGALIK